MQASVCRLNVKAAPDTEALSCSSWWQNDEQFALRKNTSPIQRQITHSGRCGRALYNEWTSERDKDRVNIELWILKPGAVVQVEAAAHSECLHEPHNPSLIHTYMVSFVLTVDYLYHKLKAK